jgi:hypothetical protein
VAHPVAIGIGLIDPEFWGSWTDQQLQILGGEGRIGAQFPPIPAIGRKVRVALRPEVPRHLDQFPIGTIEIRIGPTRGVARMKFPLACQTDRAVLEVGQSKSLAPSETERQNSHRERMDLPVFDERTHTGKVARVLPCQYQVVSGVQPTTAKHALEGKEEPRALDV